MKRPVAISSTPTAMVTAGHGVTVVATTSASTDSPPDIPVACVTSGVEAATGSTSAPQAEMPMLTPIAAWRSPRTTRKTRPAIARAATSASPASPSAASAGAAVLPVIDIVWRESPDSAITITNQVIVQESNVRALNTSPKMRLIGLRRRFISADPPHRVRDGDRSKGGGCLVVRFDELGFRVGVGDQSRPCLNPGD